MRQGLAFLTLLVLLVAPTWATAGRQRPLPPEADVEAARAKLREQLKDDYAKAASPADRSALSEKIARQANNESSDALHFVALLEAREQAALAGDLARVLKYARHLDYRFALGKRSEESVAAVRQALGSGPASEAAVAKLVPRELALPFRVEDQVELALSWEEAAEKEEGAAKLAMQRRAWWWLMEVSYAKSSPGGIVAAVARTRVDALAAALDEAEAKDGRFSLYEGIWSADYGGRMRSAEYAFGASGKVVGVGKNGPRGKLVRRDGKVLLELDSGEILECQWRSGALALTYFAKGDYPEKPGVTGVARRTAAGAVFGR
jgi:hypothetical protein